MPLRYAQAAVNLLPQSSAPPTVLVLGSFVADVSFHTSRFPVWGETMIGSGFALGPGGKGSNQAVAAARSGAHVRIVTRLGRDSFAELALQIWAEAGIDASLVTISEEGTGAAAILIEEARGENAIIVVPGACFTLRPEDVQGLNAEIAAARIFLTQLELPLETVERGLHLARVAGVRTVLNPAPAPERGLSDSLLGLVDVLIPNETEAAKLTGLPVTSAEEALGAARQLQKRGAADVIVTLGDKGALVCERGQAPVYVAPFQAGPCLETTGAGDAFCGAFAAALAEGASIGLATRFASAAAGLSVTRAGTASSMPQRREIDALLTERSRSARR